MSRSRLRWFFFSIGLVLLAVLLHSLDLSLVLAQLRSLGGYFAIITLTSGFKYCLRTLAWQLALGERGRLSFWTLFWARLAGEAANYLSSGGAFVGDPLKVMLVRDRLSWSEGLASVLLERAAYSFTAVLVLLAGLLYALVYFSLPPPFGLIAMVSSSLITITLVIAIYAFLRQWPLIGWCIKVGAKLPLVGRIVVARRQAALDVEERLYIYRHSHPANFRRLLVLNLLSHWFTIYEVYLIFQGLGVPLSYSQALLVEALTKANESLFFFVPAGVGTFEAGNLVIVRLLQKSATVGLAVAFTRRLRSLFWAVLGILALLGFGIRPQQLLHGSLPENHAEPIVPTK
ncbi:MAG: lysylphosphatidylglycerol synthase domain-containing protein [Acidobacteriota bacterium]